MEIIVTNTHIVRIFWRLNEINHAKPIAQDLAHMYSIHIGYSCPPTSPSKSSWTLLQGSYRGAGQVKVSAGTPITEQDCQVLDLSGRQERIRVVSTLVHPAGWRPRPSLLGARVGNSLSCFPQGLQQSVHAVLRVDTDLLVGQVNVKLNSCKKRGEGGQRRSQSGSWIIDHHPSPLL